MLYNDDDRLFVFVGERFSILSSGELYVRDVEHADLNQMFKCFTHNTLTGERQTGGPAHLLETGMYRLYLSNSTRNIMYDLIMYNYTYIITTNTLRL